MARDIEFFFDIGSPYSYLAATQMQALGERTGAAVHWKPFLLGGVFKAVGNTMPAALEQKADWMFRDLQMWAEHYDEPFQMSSHFPINSLRAQRALVATRSVAPQLVPDFALALYRDYWAHDTDVSEAEAIGEAAQRVGLDAEQVVEMTADAAVKAELRELTEEAVARGAFGAPTFFAGEEMFWGNDRLLFVEKAALGEL